MKINLILVDKYKDRDGIDHDVGAITTAYKTVDEATEVYMKWRDAVKSQNSEIHWDFAIVQKDIPLFNGIPWRDRVWTVVCTTNFDLNVPGSNPECRLFSTKILPSPEMAENILADLVNRPKFHIDECITKVVKRNDYDAELSDDSGEKRCWAKIIPINIPDVNQIGWEREVVL